MAFSNEIDPAWKNIEILTIEQAAALMAGFDPNNVIFNPLPSHFRGLESGTTDTTGINRVFGCFTMLITAIENNSDKKLRADIIRSARLCDSDDQTGGNVGIISKYEWFDKDNDDIGRQDIIYSTVSDWSHLTGVPVNHP